MFNRLDYLSIGTVGFAQVGTPTYHEKIEIEKNVLNAFFNQPEYQVPSEFLRVARFRWYQCPHDFGTYWDLQIVYNRDTVEDWEESEEDFQKNIDFWKWVNNCESAMSDYGEQLEKTMELLYMKTITMEVVHKKMEDGHKGLKVV